MPGPYDAMFAPDAAAQAAALEKLLRQRQALGYAGLLSGDKVIAPVGGRVLGDMQAQQQAQAEAANQQIGRLLQVRGLQRQEAADADARARWEQEMGLKREGLQLDQQKLGLERDRLNKPPGAEKPASPDDLREEFQKLQPFKDFNQISAAYKKIQTTSDTGAGDMSLIFGYMKLLDPNSTVREGEYATAAQAGSLPQGLLAQYNKIVSGEKLAPDVRKQFRDEATKVYGAQKSEFDRFASYYVRLAKQRGLNPADVVLGYEEPKAPAASAPAAPVAQTAGAQGQPAQRVQGKDGKWYVLTPAGWEAE